MAWNEPGGNNRDPWGNNSGRDQGPPDLDELVKKLTDKLGGLFGGKSTGSGGGGPSPSNIRIGGFGFWVIAAIVAALWLMSGFYVVDQGRLGVETRFGKLSDTTLPGLSYHWPFPIEAVNIVDVAQRRSREIGYRSGSGGQTSLRSILPEALMLTEDENIVDVRLSVQYQIKDPAHFLFNVELPDETLVQVIESTTREVVGRGTMDFLLTEGRSEVVAEVKDLSQSILDEYETGLEITNVNLQDAQPPDEVQEAFADVIKAREDRERLINEAEAYRNEVLPVARGAVERQLQEAEAYRDQVIAKAEGDARRFEQLLVEYSKAPDVTRERLYIETIEVVLGETSVLLMGADQGNNLLFLPLDQLMNRSATRPPLKPGSSSGAMGGDLPGLPRSDSGSSATGSRLRATDRSRENRS